MAGTLAEAGAWAMTGTAGPPPNNPPALFRAGPGGAFTVATALGLALGLAAEDASEATR